MSDGIASCTCTQINLFTCVRSFLRVIFLSKCFCHFRNNCHVFIIICFLWNINLNYQKEAEFWAQLAPQFREAEKNTWKKTQKWEPKTMTLDNANKLIVFATQNNVLTRTAYHEVRTCFLYLNLARLWFSALHMQSCVTSFKQILALQPSTNMWFEFRFHFAT